MNFIEDTIYAHDFNNPPEANSGCDFDIVLESSTGMIFLQKLGTVKHQTEYRLKVNKPQKLGCGSLADQSVQQKFICTVLSSCNLLLKTACLSDRMFSISKSKFDNSIPPKIERNTVTFTPTNLGIELSTSTSGREDLSEEKVISIIDLLNILENTKLNISVNNMKKSLAKFAEAMGTDNNRLAIFSLLCNSLEIAACYDSDEIIRDWTEKVIEVIGSSLQIDRETTITHDVLDKWRHFYNRTKHPDENQAKVSSFHNGQENLPSHLGPLREVTQKVILDRLVKIAHQHSLSTMSEGEKYFKNF